MPRAVALALLECPIGGVKDDLVMFDAMQIGIAIEF